MIVRDFVAWTSRRKTLAGGCEERLRAYVDDSGWTEHLLNQMAAVLGWRTPRTDPGTGHQ